MDDGGEVICSILNGQHRDGLCFVREAYIGTNDICKISPPLHVCHLLPAPQTGVRRQRWLRFCFAHHSHKLIKARRPLAPLRPIYSSGRIINQTSGNSISLQQSKATSNNRTLCSTELQPRGKRPHPNRFKQQVCLLPRPIPVEVSQGGRQSTEHQLHQDRR